jgi:hypothetical protein
LERTEIAIVEVIRNMDRIGISLLHVMNLLYFIEAIKEVVNANSPDNAVASPYEGIRNGRRVIIKIPKPNPVVLWIKLAPIANRNISNIFSANNCESIKLSYSPHFSFLPVMYPKVLKRMAIKIIAANISTSFLC